VEDELDEEDVRVDVVSRILPFSTVAHIDIFVSPLLSVVLPFVCQAI
jgi:hypothetical protein